MVSLSQHRPSKRIFRCATAIGEVQNWELSVNALIKLYYFSLQKSTYVNISTEASRHTLLPIYKTPNTKFHLQPITACIYLPTLALLPHLHGLDSKTLLIPYSPRRQPRIIRIPEIAHRALRAINPRLVSFTIGEIAVGGADCDVHDEMEGLIEGCVVEACFGPDIYWSVVIISIQCKFELGKRELTVVQQSTYWENRPSDTYCHPKTVQTQSKSYGNSDHQST